MAAQHSRRVLSGVDGDRLLDGPMAALAPGGAAVAWASKF
jgi:hypothetical protein